MTKPSSSFWKFSLGGLTAVCVVLSATAAPAQTAGDGDDYAPIGARLGGFLLYPKLTVKEQFSDNIFKADTAEQEDFITEISPNLNLQSDWNRHSLQLDVGADIGRYADSNDDDYEDYDFRARGRIDGTQALTFNGEARYRMLHEERGGDDVATDAAAPAEYTRANGEISAEYKPNRFGLTLETTADDYDYDDNPTIGGGTTNNDDRDRLEWTASVRAGYEIQDEYEAYLKATYNDRNYDDSLDDNGLNRDSDGYNIQAGLAVDLTRLVRADVAVGWMEQDYADSALDDADGFSADARVRWSFTELTTIRFNALRAINETTSNNVSSILFTSVGAGVDHEFLRNLNATADAKFSTSDYQGDPASREDDKLTLSAGLDYKLNRNFFGGLGYTYENRDSNINTNDYSNNIVRLTVGAQF